MAIALARLFGGIPPDLLERLPVFSMISDQYWGAMICFPFCILVAYGVDALSPRTVGKWPTLAILAFLGACFFFLLGRLGFANGGPARLHLQVFLGLIGAIVLAFTVLRWQPRARPVIAAILVAMIAGELIFYMNRMRPERKELDFDSIKWARFLRDNLEDGRVMNIGGRGLYPNWGSGLAIPQVSSLDAVNLRWYGEFFDQRFGKSGIFLALRRERSKDKPVQLRHFDLKALDVLSVRYVMVSTAANYLNFFSKRRYKRVFNARGIAVFQNPNPYPRAFAANALVEAPGIPSDHGLGRRVALTTDRELLDAASELGIPSQAPGSGRKRGSTVEIAEYHHARVELEASLKEPAIVVLTDVWHPAWRARVDGEPVHLGRVDDVLRGVALPAGDHRIVMTYAPRSLPLAIVVSLLTLAFLLWRIWAKHLILHFRGRAGGASTGEDV